MSVQQSKDLLATQAFSDEVNVSRAIDNYMEASRKDLRDDFDFARWEVHRSTHRYWRHIAGLTGSRMVLGMTTPLLYVIALSVGVCSYESAFEAGALPAGFPDLEIKAKELFGLTSFALSLLLVFRTNASYERWDGARKMWASVVNRSRDFGLTYMPAEQAELRVMLCRWVPAFSKTLMCHLRNEHEPAKELQGILLPHEIAAVCKSTHRPNYVLQVLAQIVKTGKAGVGPTLRMEDNITNFEDCLGGCERILRTPVPLYYARHTSRFMIIWLTLLPFTLWPTCGWSTVPLVTIISFLLLGIKEITITIEEPFSILALEAISNTALADVRELEAMHNVVPQRGDEAVPAFSATDMVAMALLGSSANGSNGAGAHALNGNGAASGVQYAQAAKQLPK
ncbi:hypothetical protein N2152v2_004639 [Parachlorella kessleri]